ncbi:MAG: acetylxylan esterase [Opitutaceae bacterium]|jgi:cephalosporin-C deacetylase-like acetyl esterase|nr:acetylxylan esterase [Opitutaceae bacterium]
MRNPVSILAKFTAAVALLIGATVARLPAQDRELRFFPSPSPSGSKTENLWNTDELSAAPACHDVSTTGFFAHDGIIPVFYEGVPYQNRPTRVFAWVGIPNAQSGAKVPGIVLVHGGGGTAFRDWVKLWMDRGYAAIAMDTCGCIPVAEDGMAVKSKRHPDGGAPFAGGGFKQAGLPVQDQWMYHAVAAVIRGHSLLRSMPGVDADRIGLTGISWGGIITEIVASVDNRFKFAAPVYGCGFLGENSFWLTTEFQKTDTESVETWLRLWDPSQHLFRARLPMLFCNGTNDKHFRPDSWQKTYRLVSVPVTLSLKPRMGHGHPPSGDPREITVFADSIFKGTPPPPAVIAQGESQGHSWIEYKNAVPLKGIHFLYTQDGGDWSLRTWRQESATVSGNRGSFAIPAGATAWYFNLLDERGCIVSSEHHTPAQTYQTQIP